MEERDEQSHEFLSGSKVEIDGVVEIIEYGGGLTSVWLERVLTIISKDIAEGYDCLWTVQRVVIGV